MHIPAITDLDVSGKTLVVRADLNVPMADGRITDHTRITRFAEGMRPILMQGAKLVILTHLGRPEGQHQPGLSTCQLRDALATALGATVEFCPDVSGPNAVGMSRGLVPGGVLLCENLRFDRRETENDPGLAQDLAGVGEIYVNDAFSCAHRAHASTEAITRYLPATAGPLMIKELGALNAALDAPQRPVVAIVGGAKVSSKIGVLRHLVSRVDALVIGGGMANTFLYADGAPMGKSLFEADQAKTVTDIRREAIAHNCAILLPKDVECALRLAENAPHVTVQSDQCPDTAMILDAGPDAVSEFGKALGQAGTILWNGPLGAFETPPFDRATLALAQLAAGLTKSGQAVTVAGGGDTVAALNKANVTNDFTYVSTAGGAFLEWLEGKTLPGIAALMSASRAA